ncbi:MAG: NPCBM/NEW2 domain-containing protein [Pontiellaceae bacterium]|nr:NPCBM/NEW2 domain-containing protein [Pontiellaceae bacterium]MBN2786042.1 NPCBM/NEW2 domain-containing protein [Pontiellaceae bacterium]
MICKLIVSMLTLHSFAVVAAPPSSTHHVPLSSLELLYARQGWGKPGYDCSVESRPLTVAGRRYDQGFGTHAPSELSLDLNGGSERFTAQVGVDDEVGRKGSVEFMVEGDGNVLWRSPVMRGGMTAVKADVDVRGVKHLILRVADGGDGMEYDHADWGDAMFRVVGEPPVAVKAPPPPPRWELGKGVSTIWSVNNDTRLPQSDFIEQGGLRVGQVVRYSIDARRALSVHRSVVWPGLRTIPNDTHGSLIQEYTDDVVPTIMVDGTAPDGIIVNRVVLDGSLTFEGTLGSDIAVVRRIFPSPTARTALDVWVLRNGGHRFHTIETGFAPRVQRVVGPYGTNILETACTAPTRQVLSPGQEMHFAVLFSARLEVEPAEKIDVEAEDAARCAYVAGLQRALRLETPVPEFDRAFAFCKLRVAESINATRGGLMLAPGGLRYYAAAWCNDNVEYAGPFFPFLGDAHGNQASLNTYRLFQTYMKPDYGRIPSSIIAEGTDHFSAAGDRGDAAMYAYGCARFCLAFGDQAVAEELWPAIAWSLEYCRRHLTPEGVVASDSDELERRLPAGNANLSTACLYYGGLRAAVDLGRALGRNDEADDYARRADAMAENIETYFGSTVSGFDTYRYYAGNDVLRSWICLPLCMGLMDRRDATIDALFSPQLWTDDGLASQEGDRSFWDRSTLYGFRGALQAGETRKALPFLTAYTRRRLLGEHVPYPVEAWPEGDQRQLSSECALYCRIFTEGLFGILPTGLDRFRCTPRLPKDWPRMALRSIRAFGHDFDIIVERHNNQLHLKVTEAGRIVLERDFSDGESIEVRFPERE